MIFLLAVSMFLLMEGPASAYVDPGTGSLIYQTILTILLGAGLVFRRARSSIIGFVRRLGSRIIASDRPAPERD